VKIPFSRPGDESEVFALNAEFNDLWASNSARIDRMKTYREEGAQVRNPDMLLNITDSADYGKRRRDAEPRRHVIPLPLGKALTVKHSFRIAGRLPDCIVDRRDDTPKERHRSDYMEKIVWSIIRESQGDTAFADGAWDASEMGAAAFDMYFDVGKQMPLLRACDPTGIVEVQGVDDPHDFQRVYKAWNVPLKSLQAQYRDQVYLGEAVRVSAMLPEFQIGTVDYVTVVQMCDKQRRVKFVSGCNVGLEDYTHGLGVVPYVIIPNIGPYRDVWGWADYEFVRPLVHYIQSLFGREADVIRQVANGSYIATGTGQSAADIKKTLRDGGVMPDKKDAEIRPIEAAEMPSFEGVHAERAMELLKMLGFAPDASWGTAGAQSGSDRGLQLQPLLEYTALKQKNWEAGMTRLFGMAYKIMETKMAAGATYRGTKPVGFRRMPFFMDIGPSVPPLQAESGGQDEMGLPEFVELPRSPKELFDGDYAVRFMWQNRIDPDDPAYVMSELNKFQQGAQSLRTTLERLGFQAPEDEIKQIEDEANRFPWLNNGMVALLKQQLGGQGAGGGNPTQQGDPLGDAMDPMLDASGGLDADAGAGALGGGAVGTPCGSA
jgi:hypothetical protein